MRTKTALSILCYLYIPLLLAWPQPSDLTLRMLSSGQIRGRHLTTSRNTNGYVFLGIPYAEPPLGYLRYRAPRTVQPWKGVIEVKEYRNSCLWNSTITSNIPEFMRMSEDCLTLNVFTNARCLLSGGCAVVYMIHGGDYNFDSPMLYPADFLVDNFASEDRSVIVVTVTYRLGSFGFLNLSPKLKSSAAKNIGLLEHIDKLLSKGWPLLTAIGEDAPKFADMIEGLRWVQREISNFGGDPNGVTLMGHSSGAVNAHQGSVTLENCKRINEIFCAFARKTLPLLQLTVSPLTKGLFHQAIIMSGMFGIPTPPNNGEHVSRQFARAAGCANEHFDNDDPESVETVLNCLRKVDGRKLISVQRYIEDDGFIFQGPCVDGRGGVLPKSVVELLREVRPMKMMIGTVEKEMQNTDYLVCKDESVDWKGVKETCAAVTAMFGYRNKRRATNMCTMEYVKPYKTPYILDDPCFFVNAALYSEAVIRAGGRVFLYQFDYANVGDAFYLGPLIPKYTPAQSPHHTQEFVYVVGIHLGNFTAKDEIIRVKFSQLFINFINKGDPSPPDQRWMELRPEIMNYFAIDFDEQNNMPGMKVAYHAHEIKFWNKTMLRNGGGRVPITDEAVLRSNALVDIMSVQSPNDDGSGGCRQTETNSSKSKSHTLMQRHLRNVATESRRSLTSDSLKAKEGGTSVSAGLWTVILMASLLTLAISAWCAAFVSKREGRIHYERIE